MVLKQQMVFPGDKGLQSPASAEKNWRFNICIVEFKRRAPGGAACRRLAGLCLSAGNSPSPGHLGRARTHRNPQPSPTVQRLHGPQQLLIRGSFILSQEGNPNSQSLPFFTLTACSGPVL